MTIAAACLTTEGVLFGADSTQTFTFQNGTEKFYNNAQKIFEIGKPGESRFGLCVWGDALLGDLAHRTVAARLSDLVRPDTRLQDLVQELLALGKSEEATNGRVFVGCFLGGTQPGSRIPVCTRVMFGKKEEALLVLELPPLSALFQGAPRFFMRLHNGYDPELKDLILAGVKEEMVGSTDDEKEVAANAFSVIFDRSAGKLPPMQWPTMPLRDALDYLHTYLWATVKSHKFMLGSPICGGVIELAMVTSDRPFRWVRHKPFDSAINDSQ